MKCIHCNCEIPDGSKFCVKCGKKIEVPTVVEESVSNDALVCGECGATLKPGAKFCTTCGKPVGTTPVAEEKVEESPAPVVEEKVEESPAPVVEEKVEEAPAPVVEEKVEEAPASVVEEKVEEASAPVVEEKTQQFKFCTGCGKKILADAKFCTGCGKVLSAGAPKEQSKKTEPEKTAPVQQNRPAPKKESGGSGAIIAAVIVIVLLLLAIAGLCLKIFVIDGGVLSGNSKHSVESVDRDDDDEDDEDDDEDKDDVKKEDSSDEDSKDVAKSDEDIKVDYDLSEKNKFTLIGKTSPTKKNWVLTWDDPYTFMDVDDDGDPIYVTDCTQAIIIMDDLPDNIFDKSEKEEISIKGVFSIVDDELYVEPRKVKNSKDQDMVSLAEKELNGDDDYIIPDSDTRLLTDADVADLSLQEINYAKNEIYARHGYMFESKELQDYFGSKSWYEPLYPKAQFDKLGLISSVENQNASFLSSVEASMGMYQLDQ